MWTNWAPWALLVRMEHGVAIVKDSGGRGGGAVPQRVTHRMAMDPAISLLGINPEERKAGSRTTVCMRSQQHHSQPPKGRSSQVSITERMDKQTWSIRRVEYYSVSKRKESLSHTTTWMDQTRRTCWGRQARHQRTNTVWFHFYQGPRGQTHRDRK